MTAPDLEPWEIRARSTLWEMIWELWREHPGQRRFAAGECVMTDDPEAAHLAELAAEMNAKISLAKDLWHAGCNVHDIALELDLDLNEVRKILGGQPHP